MYDFYHRHMKYGCIKALWHVYLNHCKFGEIIVDRFAMYAGKKFKITIEGYEHFDKLAKSESGFIQLSSHIGNYELAGYSLQAKEKRFNALVYSGEKASVMENRAKLFGHNNIRMIPINGKDLTHLFTLDQALSDGEILSMPADRTFGSPKTLTGEFFGEAAKFPQGPFIMAALREVPLLFVAVMKSGWNSYQIFVKELTLTVEESTGLTSRKRSEKLLARYCREMEQVISRYPTQWFNYFKFWTK